MFFSFSGEMVFYGGARGYARLLGAAALWLAVPVTFLHGVAAVDNLCNPLHLQDSEIYWPHPSNLAT